MKPLPGNGVRKNFLATTHAYLFLWINQEAAISPAVSPVPYTNAKFTYASSALEKQNCLTSCLLVSQGGEHMERFENGEILCACIQSVALT